MAGIAFMLVKASLSVIGRTFLVRLLDNRRNMEHFYLTPQKNNKSAASSENQSSSHQKKEIEGEFRLDLERLMNLLKYFHYTAQSSVLAVNCVVHQVDIQDGCANPLGKQTHNSV